MATVNTKPKSPELEALLRTFEAWLYTHVKLCNSTAALSTAALYVDSVKRAYPFIGPDPSEAKIMEYIVGLRRKETASNYVSAICTALERFSASLGRPISLIRPPKVKTVFDHILAEAEIAVFIHCAKNLREKAMLSLLAYTGIRNKEFCAVRVKDVDIANGLIRVTITKFNKERLVGVAGECVATIVEYLQGRNAKPDDLLFVTSRNGNQLQTQDLRKLVRVVAKRAGFDRRIWPHLFRHSLATNMIERGAHLLTVRDQLGHVYVDSTMVYVHRSKKGHSNDYRQHAPSYT